MIQKLARHWSLMNAMARRRGVDLGLALNNGEIARNEVGKAVFQCARCAHLRDCKTLLSLEPEGEAKVPEYCINKSMMERLQVRNLS